jgi:L-seryl-tRNA(Ser) seleniumtransferase
MPRNSYRPLPSIDRVISDQRLAGRRVDGPLVEVSREVLDGVRRRIAGGGEAPSFDDIVEEVGARLDEELRPPLYPLVNATGVIIHTNLGRAPLAAEAVEAMASVAAGYSNLEYDVASGPAVCATPSSAAPPPDGAEAAMAVNNAGPSAGVVETAGKRS